MRGIDQRTLLIAVRIPPFTKRAKRRVAMHPKFFFFDADVSRAIRPKGPLDSPEEAEGPAVETLVLAHLRAWNDYGVRGCTGVLLADVARGRSVLIANRQDILEKYELDHNRGMDCLLEFAAQTSVTYERHKARTF